MDSAQNMCVLHSVCTDGKADDIQQYLEVNGNQHINTHDKTGLCPIHYIFKHRLHDIEEVLDILISHKVDINTRTLFEGDTCLHIVVDRFPEDEAIALTLKLLSHGGDPDYRNDKYRTAYDIALSKSMMRVAEYLSSDMSAQDAKEELANYNRVDYGSLLVKSVMLGNQEDLDICLHNKADPDHINEHGAGAIHYTVTHCPLDKLSVLQKLVEAGGNVNLQTYEGDTALNLVIKTTQLRTDNVMEMLVHKLLEWGSDQTLIDLDDKNALMLAQDRGYSDIVQILSNPRGYPADDLDLQQDQRPLSSTPSVTSKPGDDAEGDDVDHQK